MEFFIGKLIAFGQRHDFVDTFKYFEVVVRKLRLISDDADDGDLASLGKMCFQSFLPD